MISRQFAELAGFFSADGCMQENYICFWGNMTEDKPYYDGVLTVLFQYEFCVNPRCHYKPSNFVYGFYICKRSIIRSFQNLGFSPGSKTYTVKVPEDIMNDPRPEIWASFIRGFFDGDGCLTFSKRKGTYSEFKRKYHIYPRILLSSRSPILMRQIQQLLTKLEINATLYICKPGNAREKSAYVIAVRGSAMLEKWMNVVGTHNMAKHTKYLVWKKQGFCKSYTNLKERVAILADIEL